MTEKLLDRVGALLAKAESTDSAHEAEALVAKAQQLATLHSVDLAVARQRTQRRNRREQVTQRKIPIGRRGEMGLRHRVLLFVAVAHVNDLTVDVARDSTYVIAFGFPSDLDVTQALYASLSTQMTAAVTAAIKRGEHKEDCYWSEAAGGWRSDARVYRSAFYEGFIAAVGKRLTAARSAALVEGDTRSSSAAGAAGGSELVLLEKAAEVQAFHAQTSDARGSWRGTFSAQAATSYGAHRAGRTAGRNARLAGQRSIAGARGHLEG